MILSISENHSSTSSHFITSNGWAGYKTVHAYYAKGAGEDFMRSFSLRTCTHRIYHFHFVTPPSTDSPFSAPRLQKWVGCVNIMYYVSRIIQFIIYQFRHNSDINNYITTNTSTFNHNAMMADVSNRLLPLFLFFLGFPFFFSWQPMGKKSKQKKKEIYQKFNRAAILFMRVYVSDEKRRKALICIYWKIPEHCAIRERILLHKKKHPRNAIKECFLLSNKHQTTSLLIK